MRRRCGGYLSPLLPLRKMKAGKSAARPGSSLLGNVGYNFTAFLLGKGASAIAVLLLMRMLGPQGAGFYSGALGFAFLFGIIVDPGMGIFLTREVSQRRKDAGTMFSRALKAQFLQVMVGAIGIAVFLEMGGAGSLPPGLVMAAFAGVALAGIGNTASSGLQGLEEFRTASLVAGACSWLNALALLVVLATVPSPFMALVSWTISGVIGAAIWLRVGSRFGLAFHLAVPARVGDFWRRMTPFTLLAVSNQLYLRQGMALLAWMVDAVSLGFYGTASRVADLLYPIFGSLSGPLYSRISFLGRDGTRGTGLSPAVRGNIGRTLSQALRLLGAFCFPIGVGGSILAGPLMIFLFGDEFRGSGPMFRWLVWVPVLAGMHYPLLHSLNALRRTGWVAVIFSINTAVAVLANIFMVPIYGPVVVAVSFVVCEFATLIVATIMVGWASRIPLSVSGWFWPVVPAGAGMGLVLSLLPVPSGFGVMFCVVGGAVCYALLLYVMGFFGEDERAIIGRVKGWLTR